MALPGPPLSPERLAMRLRRALLPLLALTLPTPAAPRAQEGDPPPRRALEHEDTLTWRSLSGTQLAADGRRVLYTLRPMEGDSELVIRELVSGTERRVERASSARFDADGAWAFWLVQPTEEERDEARREKLPAEEQPQPVLHLLAPGADEPETVERVASLHTPSEASGVVAWMHADPSALPDGVEAEEGASWGRDLVVRRTDGDGVHTVPYARQVAFASDGAHLAVVADGPDGSSDGLWIVDARSGTARHVHAGDAEIRSLTFSDSGDRLAYFTRERVEDEGPWSIWMWSAGDELARPVVRPGETGIPSGWEVRTEGRLDFSDSGNRLFFGTAPPREPAPEEPEADERVELDIWSWKDDLLQPMQLVQVERERRRTYQAVAHVHAAQARVVQLATSEVPDVSLGVGGDGPWVLASTDLPYRAMMSWDTQTYRDVWRIDALTGARERVLERRRGSFGLSPEGRWISWWDGEERHWFAMPTEGGEVRNVSADVPFPLHNELDDRPALPSAYGRAGWLPGDAGMVVYDKHDLWLLDPTGQFAPRCVTEGVGRRQDLRLRFVDLDPDEVALPVDEPLLLSAFHLTSKDAGFYRDAIAGSAEPRALVMEPCSFGTPVKARDADVLRFTRATFRDYPDVWISDLDFLDRERVSDANPQQAEFLWGDAELVDWTSPAGDELQGILYKPDDFDPDAEYPLLVYFYERMSDGLHRYSSPTPGGSSIKYPFYTSRGYLVFVPDIPYRIGHPGESALEAVTSGIEAVTGRGFVDEDAIGVQGHSWGGYQIAYMVTKTDLFTAAVAGAPVSNMTSAYGGIRWSSGMSRMFQYEKTQSRIGATLWEARDLYLENSPVFFADAVDTPLLMMHNDEDGAVPWYQGIEYFVALRRLGKPAWLLNYNDEGHGLSRRANRNDYAVRMQQFFDHYLLGAPAPVWIAEGVPAIEKGRNLGLDLVESDAGEE